MERFIFTQFIFITLISIARADFASAMNDSHTENFAGKYPLVYVSLPAKIFKNQESMLQWKEPGLQIYCYQGIPRHWINIWVSVSMEISLEPEEYDHYDGSTPQEVVAAFEQRNAFWQISLFSWNGRIRAKPGEGSCVGIYGPRKRYEIFLYSQQIDYWKPALLISGIVLYLQATKISQSSIFYYLCAIFLGHCAALLLLVYFINRIVTIPKGPLTFLVFLAAGWLVRLLRIMNVLWDYIQHIGMHHWSVFVTYMIVASLISVAICYRIGPERNPRTRNLIKWSLQIVSLYSMYLSSELQEASISTIILFLAIVNFPRGVLQRLRIHRVFSPAPRRLLTTEEYRKEGADYTADSLEELRNFCSSPGCNKWEVIKKLQVPPKKVADFVMGRSHVSVEERQEHQLDSSSLPMEVTDDSDF